MINDRNLLFEGRPPRSQIASSEPDVAAVPKPQAATCLRVSRRPDGTDGGLAPFLGRQYPACSCCVNLDFHFSMVFRTSERICFIGESKGTGYCSFSLRFIEQEEGLRRRVFDTAHDLFVAGQFPLMPSLVLRLTPLQVRSRTVLQLESYSNPNCRSRAENKDSGSLNKRLRGKPAKLAQVNRRAQCRPALRS